MKFIPSTRGFLNIVDDNDYPELSKYSWFTLKCGRRWCTARHSPTVNGKRHTLLMHCEIVGTRPGMEIDHITHAGEEDGIIDNRRENLRFCTHAQNLANRRKRAGSSSQYRGVYWYKSYQRWCACIVVNGKRKYLGYFDSEEDAARAYDAAARSIYGVFAESFVNFPKS